MFLEKLCEKRKKSEIKKEKLDIQRKVKKREKNSALLLGRPDTQTEKLSRKPCFDLGPTLPASASGAGFIIKAENCAKLKITEIFREKTFQ